MNAGGSPELPTPEPTGTSVGGDSNGAGGTGGGPSANPSSSCPIATGDTLAQLLKTRQPVALAKIPDDDFDGGFIVLEGPLWVDDSLYLSQINITTDGVPPPARLMRFNPDAAALEVVATDSGSNGLQRAPDGKVAAARHSDGSIAYITLAANLAPQPIVSQYMGARFDSPNDLVFHPNGTLFFSDPDWQAPKPPPQSVERLYRLAPGGEVQAVDAALNAPTIIQKPNGVAVTHDGATLYVGGKNGLFRFSLDADANVMGTGVELEIAGTELTVANEEEYVDGITIDCAENIYFASNGKIIVLDSQEKYLGEIAVPTPTDPSNIEIGGPNGTTAYITTNQGDTQENNDATAVKPSLYAYDLSMP
jgi:gluconolactonase